MHIQIDFRAEQPIYIQIVEQIRQLIAAGELQVGDQLPTVRQLAADLRVNFNTVARAYRLLDEAGLISTQQGRGTYIWEAPPPQAAQRLREQGLNELAGHFIEEAQRLGYQPGEVRAAFEAHIAAWNEAQSQQ
ncbi:MAG: GntR family transcriptional regulator [Anaerolineales bacterium]|nr:GntR family transcriptional regulator [Anaerolineales bacterium]